VFGSLFGLVDVLIPWLLESTWSSFLPSLPMSTWSSFMTEGILLTRLGSLRVVLHFRMIACFFLSSNSLRYFLRHQFYYLALATSIKVACYVKSSLMDSWCSILTLSLFFMILCNFLLKIFTSLLIHDVLNKSCVWSCNYHNICVLSLIYKFIHVLETFHCFISINIIRASPNYYGITIW